MVVSYKLIASNRTHEAITSDAETALSIARVALALQLQGDFILSRQFNFGMASLERVAWSLFDAFDEGQIESYAQTVHRAPSLKRLLSCYVTNMIEREPRLPWSWTLT